MANDKVKKSILFDYKLHLTILFVSVVSLAIGTINIPLSISFNLVIPPFIPAFFISLFFYLLEQFTWVSKLQSKCLNKYFLIIICPLVVKLAIASGQNIELLFDVGPVLILKEIGSIGTILIGLPLALLLGFKRESIGMTSSICREPQLAVLVEKYAFDSEEVKGFFIVYVIGLVFGTLFISVLTSVLCYILPLNPLSYALASGIGSTSMSVSALSSLVTIYPSLSSELLAFGGISNLISVVFGVYVYMFISLPLTERLYNKFYHYFN